MNQDKDTELQILRIECNYLHHKLNQLFHEIKVQNINDPLHESFKKKCEIMFRCYQGFCQHGPRNNVDLSRIFGDDEDPE